MEELIEKTLPMKHSSDWSLLIPEWKQRYQLQITHLRQLVKQQFHPVTAENIEAVHAALTTGYQALLKKMLEESFRLIGRPPCPYAWIGSGSYSRGEVLPYSDVEYLWLFEGNDLAVRQYFFALDKSIIAQINSLDEQGGLHPDQYPEVSETSEGTDPLPHGLEMIVRGVAIKCKAPQGVYTQLISLLQGKLIAGEEALWTRYLDQLKGISLSSAFRKVLFVSVADYETTWEKEVGAEDRQDAKKGYGFFLTYLAVMLKFYHGVEGESTQAIWQGLVQARKLPAKLGEQLAWASREIQALRYRLQCLYREGRQDFIAAQDKRAAEDIYPLTPIEEATLSQIKNLIDQVYSHLKAIKYLEQATKSPKENLKKGAVTIPHSSTLTRFALLETVIQHYKALQPPLLSPVINESFLQSLLKKLLDDPGRLVQPALQGILDFVLTHGGKGNVENSLGLTPMRMVMQWSERAPVLAEKTWKALMQAQGDIEESHLSYQGTLLEQSIAENKRESFIVLCQLGAGRKASADTVLAYLQSQLSSRSIVAQQCERLQGCLPLLIQQNATLAWRLALLGVREEKAQGSLVIAIEGSQTPAGFLNPVMTKALFNNQQKVQQVNEYGRRKVAKCALNPLINVYAKFYPELPGMEEAIRRLAFLLSESGIVPQSELFCFKEKKMPYPVLLSQEAKGENLQTVLSSAYKANDPEAQAKLTRLDSHRWTDLFILSVLIHPEDGKPDNYILSPCKNTKGEDSYAIVAIDNDHALVEVFNQDKDEAKAFQVKTILYCLEQMQQPLDEKAVQAFLAKSPDIVIPIWLDELEQCQARYEGLFSLEAKEKLVKKESVPQIVIPPKSIPKLYERWVQLKAILEEDPKKVALEILISVDPLVGLRYQEVFEQEKDPLSRFHTLASPAYFFIPKVGHYKTLVTSRQLLKTQAISEKLLLTTRQYSPLEAKKELYQGMEQIQLVDAFVKHLEKGDSQSFQAISLTSVKEAVLKKADFKGVDVKQQRQLIDLWLDKKEGLVGLQTLTLTNLTEIKAKALETLLKRSPHLQSLRLMGLPQITMLSCLEKVSQSLRTLILYQMNGLVNLQSSSVILQLPQLKTLQIEATPLAAIQLAAPQLRQLILGHLPDCQTLNLPHTQQLQQLKVQQCPQLSFEKVYALMAHNPELSFDHCQLDGHQDVSVEQLTVFFTQRLENPDLNDIEIWQISEGIRQFEIKTIRLQFEQPLVEIVAKLAVLVYATDLETITINTLEAESQREIQLAVKEWRALKGCFELCVKPYSLRVENASENEKALFISISKVLGLPFQVDETQQLNMPCQSGQEFYAVLSLLLSLNPSRVLWNHLDRTLTYIPNRVIGVLIKILGHEYSNVREAAAGALGQLQQATPSVIDALLKALKDKDSFMRHASVCALGQLQQATPFVIDALLKALEDSDYDVAAAGVLVQLGQKIPQSYINVLFKALRVDVLVQLGQEIPQGYVDKLLKALENKDYFVDCKAVANALGQLKQATPSVIDALLKALGDEKWEVRKAAAGALVQLGQEIPQNYIDMLLKALGDDYFFSVRKDIVAALGQLQQTTPPVIDALLKTLVDKDQYVRSVAAHALGQLQQTTALVVDALLNALGDEVSDVHEAAAGALVQLSQLKQATAPVIDMLEDNDRSIRKAAADALGQLGQATPSVIDALLKAMRDEDSCVRQAAVSALGQLKQAVEPIIDAFLKAALEDKESRVRQAAVGALGKLPQQSLSLKNLFRFKPCLSTLHATTWDMALIQFALRDTQGYLAQLTLGNQPVFNLTPLRTLQSGFDVIQTDPKTLTLQLKTKSDSIEENLSLLLHYGKFIGYLFDTSCFTFQSTLNKAVIFSEDAGLLANVKGILESLAVWAALQPMGESVLSEIVLKENLKDPIKSLSLHKEEVPLIIAASFPSPSGKSIYRPLLKPKPLPKMSRSQKSLLKPLPPLAPLVQIFSLFMNTLPYRKLFCRYREPLWNFVNGKTTITVTAETLVTDLLASAKTPLEKAILLEAAEWVKLKLTDLDEQMKVCRSNILISQSIQSVGKSPKQWNQALQQAISSYQLYVKEQLTHVTSKERSVLQQASDACLIFLTALRSQTNSGKGWSEKTFFKQLTEQQVYQQTAQAVFDRSLCLVTIHKQNSLKKLWAMIYQSAEVQLPLSVLEVRRREIETERQQQKSRYQAVLTVWQASLTPSKRWKQTYFLQPSEPVHRFGGHQGIMIHSFFHLTQPFDAKRFDIYEALHVNLSGLLGSTYFGQEKPLAAENTLCLDANYQQGQTGATADGYGHFSTLTENRKVHAAAYRTVKLMTRYVALYPDALSLQTDIPKLFTHVGHAVKYSFLHPEEAGTASCVVTRLFETNNKHTLTLVAAGVGDGMVAVFDPQTRILETLIKPRQYDRGIQFTPMSITELVASTSVICPLSAGNVLFRMTDGAWESLPHHCSEILLDEKIEKRYLEYTLDEVKLGDLLATFAAEYPIATAADYRGYLQNLIQQHIETQKTNLLQQQAALQAGLKAFHGTSTSKLGDFIAWVSQSNPQFRTQMAHFLRALNVANTALDDLPISALEHQLHHVQLGDDITLYVEIVGITPVPSLRLGL